MVLKSSRTAIESSPVQSKNWIPLAVFAAPLYLWGAAHGILTRTPEDFWNASHFIAIPLAVLIIGGIVRSTAQNGHPLTKPEVIVSLVGYSLYFAFVSFVFALLAYPVLAFILDAYTWLSSPQKTGIWVVVGASVLTAYLGALLFYFRLRLRSTYGLTEATAGVAVVAHRIGTEPVVKLLEPSLLFLILTAGIYLVVRGLDNVQQGLIGNPPDPLATKLKSSLVARLQSESSSERSSRARKGILCRK